MVKRRRFRSATGFWSIITDVATIALIVWLAWLGWSFFGPNKPVVSPERAKIALELIPDIVEDIRMNRQDATGVVLLHFRNDPSDFITDNLRESILSTGVLDLKDRTIMEKIRDSFKIRQPSYGTLEQALKKAASMGAEAVLFGDVIAFESGKSSARVEVNVGLAAVKSGEVIYAKGYEKIANKNIFDEMLPQEGISSIPLAQRFLGWVLIVLLLPVFSIAFIRAMLRKESNGVTAFILGLYTVIDAVLAYLMLGANIDGWIEVIMFLGGVGLAFLYNLRIMVFGKNLDA